MSTGKQRTALGLALAGTLLLAAGVAAAHTWLPRDSRLHFLLVNVLGRPLTVEELGHGGAADTIRFGDPVGLARGPDGAIYVADRGRDAVGHVVWRIAPDGTAKVIAGTGRKGRPDLRGPATLSDLASPENLAVDAGGGILIADSLNHVILRIAPDGTLARIAGTGEAGDDGDGGVATEARLDHPYDVRIGPGGDLYIADYGNNRIRVVSPEGRIATLAGDGTAGYTGDGGPAIQAQLDGPYGVLPLSDGSVLIADSGNHVVRRVAPDGVIKTLAGTGQAGFSGDGGPAAEARFDSPQALFATADGRVFVDDEHNKVIRIIDREGIVTTLSRQDEAAVVRFVDPENVLALADGTVLVADGDDARVLLIDEGGRSQIFAGIGSKVSDTP